MPYINGQQLLRMLEPFPDMRKVVISSSACDNLAMKASLESMGADGCICKRDMSKDPAAFCRLLSSMMRAPRKTKAVVLAARTGLATATTGYPVPADEKERLVALAALGLTNDDGDHRLDMLTEHLAKTTDFSACVMTFIDQHTQWIKSGYGLERGSTARAQAICNHTICGDEPFIVHDTSTDQRFAKFESVLTGPMIRAYVGYPIVGSAGVRLGAICLLDTRPRQITLKDLTNLRSIARIAVEFIENRSTPIQRAA